MLPAEGTKDNVLKNLTCIEKWNLLHGDRMTSKRQRRVAKTAQPTDQVSCLCSLVIDKIMVEHTDSGSTASLLCILMIGEALLAADLMRQ